MESPEKYKDWLSDFQREVTETLANVRAQAPNTPAAQRAIADFESWWRVEHPSKLEEPAISFNTEQINKELELSREEIRALRKELETLRVSPDKNKRQDQELLLRQAEIERKQSQDRLTAVEREKAELLDYRAVMQGQIVDMRLKMSQAQDGYEAHIGRLDERIRGLEDQVRALQENKKLLEEQRDDHAARAESLAIQLRTAEQVKGQSEKRALELEIKLESMRSSLMEKEAELANREGSLAELRQQAALLHERLIRGEETARAELGHLAKRGEETESRLNARAGLAEQRVSETMRFLEMKIREIQERNDEQFEEFRDLLEALTRLRNKRGGIL